jgi:hypothetical protein
MQLITPCAETSRHHLRALVALAHTASNGCAQPQRALLEALGKIPFQSEVDLDTAELTSLTGLKQHTTTAEEARQLVRLMLVVSLADGPPSVEQITLIESTALELDVDEPAIGVLRLLAEDHKLRFRIGFMRRSHLRNYFANTYRLRGAAAVPKAILVFRGVVKDTDLAARYHALADLDPDTLGRQFVDHCADAGIALPGEKGGFPEGAVYHDFTHVLSGYDTSPEGEMKAAAFQAGYTQGNFDFFTLLFAVVIHTAGVNLAPFPMPKLPGRIGQPNLALEMLHALARGTAINQDLGDSWDFWDEVEKPIENVRLKLGVKPVDTSLLAAA